MTRQRSFQGGVARSYLGSLLLGDLEGATCHAKGKRILLPVHHELLPGGRGLPFVGCSSVSPEFQRVASSPQCYCGALTTGLSFNSRSEGGASTFGQERWANAAGGVFAVRHDQRLTGAIRRSARQHTEASYRH